MISFPMDVVDLAIIITPINLIIVTAIIIAIFSVIVIIIIQAVNKELTHKLSMDQ